MVRRFIVSQQGSQARKSKRGLENNHALFEELANAGLWTAALGILTELGGLLFTSLRLSLLFQR